MSEFIRRVQVLIGPLTEVEGGGNKSRAISIDSTGRAEDYRIQFAVTKTITGAPNVTKLRVTNLPEKERLGIKASHTNVQLYAGYMAGVQPQLLSKGGVMSSLSVHDGSEIVTAFNALDGYESMTLGTFRRSYGQGVQLSSVVTDLANSMPGITIGTINIDGTTDFKGIASSGRTVDTLNKLANQYGFSWSIQNGIFQALKDNVPLNRAFNISWQNKSLIGCSPILNGPAQIQSGIEIKATLDPRVAPGTQVRLESKISPGLNGTYPVHAVDFSGDTHGDDYTMVIKSYFIL